MTRVALALVVTAAASVTVLATHKRPAQVQTSPAPVPLPLRASRSDHRLPLLPVRAVMSFGAQGATPRSSRRGPSRPAGSGGSQLNWPALALCESSDNPRAVDPTGTYFGLYQADQQTWDGIWRRHGRPDLIGVRPSAVDEFTQTRFARLLFAERGREPWPTCGRHL